jgi:ankyrin repeat domain-containing protein 50
MMEARRALLWLEFSGRPLGIEEVAEAAVVDPESDSPFNPENRLLDPHGDILEILGSLVTVSVKSAKDDPKDYIEGDSDYDSDDDDTNRLSYTRVKLAHFSVKDYLVSERIRGQKAAMFSATAIEANTFIAKSCLTYILHCSESDTTVHFPEDLPLLQYASKFWYLHATALSVESRTLIDLTAFKLSSSENSYLLCLSIYH